MHSLSSEDEADQTGSIGHAASLGDRSADAAKPSEVDLVYARAAVPDALTRNGRDASIPWQNPTTGAGGNITPLATAYTEGGQSCRGFLASYVHGGSQDWLQGAACRTDQGGWEVKSLKPLKQG
jgi:surface antigen